MFCHCASQSDDDDDDGDILGFRLGFYFLPSLFLSKLSHFAPFLVPISAFPVALWSSLDASISPFCSLGCSLSAPRSLPVAKPLSSSSFVLLLLHLAEAPGWRWPECTGRKFWPQLLSLVGRCHEQGAPAEAPSAVSVCACEYLGTSEPCTAGPERIFTWVVNTSPGFTHIFAELLISGEKHRVTGEV